MFENYRAYKTDFAGHPLTVETGKLAPEEGGGCLVRYGGTAVYSTARALPGNAGRAGRFPISALYEEKPYARGSLVPASREEKKREARTARSMERAVRPLFPEGFSREVRISSSALSVDPGCPPESAALIGAFCALCLSDIPWNGPAAAAFLGYSDGRFFVNPSVKEREKSGTELLVASTADAVVLMDGTAGLLPEDAVFAGVQKCLQDCRPVIELLGKIQSEAGKEKFQVETPPEEMENAVLDYALDDIREAMDDADRKVRRANLKPVFERTHQKFDPDSGAEDVDRCFFLAQRTAVRSWLLGSGKRVDGREPDEIRPVSAETGFLPRAQGSGLYTCGRTQALSAAALGSMEKGQPRFSARCFSHCGAGGNPLFPGPEDAAEFTERALAPVLPSAGRFPYSVCVTSEEISDDGSLFGACVSSSTLALLDAGVPLESPVAGISFGLAAENGRWKTITDILGTEAVFGGMDFEIAGTHGGITSVWTDLESPLKPGTVREVLRKAKKALDSILGGNLLKALPKPRAQLSLFAPKSLGMAVPPGKIQSVAEALQKISGACRVRMREDRDGWVSVSGDRPEDARRALGVVETIVDGPDEGAIYSGCVTRVAEEGAYVEIAPGVEGFAPLRELGVRQPDRAEDEVKKGDKVLVKVLGPSKEGIFSLSRRAALLETGAAGGKKGTEKSPATQEPLS